MTSAGNRRAETYFKRKKEFYSTRKQSSWSKHLQAKKKLSDENIICTWAIEWKWFNMISEWGQLARISKERRDVLILEDTQVHSGSRRRNNSMKFQISHQLNMFMVLGMNLKVQNLKFLKFNFWPLGGARRNFWCVI